MPQNTKQNTVEKTRGTGLTLKLKSIPKKYQTFTWRRLLKGSGSSC